MLHYATLAVGKTPTYVYIIVAEIDTNIMK